jgi:hypothetical protein
MFVEQVDEGCIFEVVLGSSLSGGHLERSCDFGSSKRAIARQVGVQNDSAKDRGKLKGCAWVRLTWDHTDIQLFLSMSVILLRQDSKYPAFVYPEPTARR